MGDGLNNGRMRGFGTKAVHSGNFVETAFGAHEVPIYQTSAFVFKDCEQGGSRFEGSADGYIYSRLGNPTVTALEQKLAALENAEAAAATGSGMGAISSAMWTVLRTGAHIIADNVLYGCTFAYLTHGLTRYGVEVTLTDLSDPENLKKALKSNTAAVYLETPANPTLKITDIKAISDIAHDFNKNIMVIADNTFATPFLQRPLELGCDAVVHSMTKYLNGHGDVVSGAVAGKEAFIKDVKMFGIKDMTGAVMSPHDAFLVNRGMKTLEVRMRRHCENAAVIVDYLSKHSAVEIVYYPGLPNHPGHETAARQMSGFGGIVSFELKGGKAAGIKLLNSLKLCTLSVSLGDVETLIEHPASMTHSTYGAEELKKAGIPEGLVRMSVGLEDPADIIEDLEQGLTK